MPDASFSLSISNRGDETLIGGSGALDVAGVGTLRRAIEDSCAKGGSVLIDLTLVSELHTDSIVHLVEVAQFCRDQGVPFSLSFGPDLLRVINEAGYDEELVPIKG